MDTTRILMIAALLIGISFVIGNSSAEDAEFDFRFDEPTDGEDSVDPEDTVELKVTIENFLDEPREYELFITNSNELESSGLDAWWSNDGQDELSSEATSLPAVDVADQSIRSGITVTVRATESALYGTYNINVKCRDKDNSAPEENKQVLDLTVNVNEKAEVSIEVDEGGNTEGSVDIDGDTTYQIKVNNDGKQAEEIHGMLIESGFKSELEIFKGIRHEPFQEKYVSNKRSVYRMQQRIQKDPYLDLFDGPDGGLHLGERKATVTTLQALYFMNSEFIHNQAQAIAGRLPDSGQVEHLYELIYNRPAQPEELDFARAYFARGDTLNRWAGFVRSMLSSNEFLYVD